MMSCPWQISSKLKDVCKDFFKTNRKLNNAGGRTSSHTKQWEKAPGIKHKRNTVSSKTWIWNNSYKYRWSYPQHHLQGECLGLQISWCKSCFTCSNRCLFVTTRPSLRSWARAQSYGGWRQIFVARKPHRCGQWMHRFIGLKKLSLSLVLQWKFRGWAFTRHLFLWSENFSDTKVGDCEFLSCRKVSKTRHGVTRAWNVNELHPGSAACSWKLGKGTNTYSL